MTLTIPDQMTERHPAESTWRLGDSIVLGSETEVDGIVQDTWHPSANVSTGLELRPYFVRWLDQSIYRQNARARLEELREVYPEAYEAHRLRKQRLTVREIAAQMTTDRARKGEGPISRSTAHRLLMKAERYIGKGTASGDAFTTEEKAMVYADLYPERFEVYVYCSYGWTQEGVAELLDISDRTVRRYVAHAREFIGEQLPRYRLKRFTRQAPRSERPARDLVLSAELARENARGPAPMFRLAFLSGNGSGPGAAAAP